jgi:hypothetical protein
MKYLALLTYRFNFLLFRKSQDSMRILGRQVTSEEKKAKEVVLTVRVNPSHFLAQVKSFIVRSWRLSRRDVPINTDDNPPPMLQNSHKQRSRRLFYHMNKIK